MDNPLRLQAHALGFRLWERDGRVHINHGGDHHHASNLTPAEAQEWLAKAEPASDDCPLIGAE
jgi:hypothetical protein